MEGLISLGPLGQDGAEATALPDTIDLGRYSIVDVSLEQPDGDPTTAAAACVGPVPER